MSSFTHFIDLPLELQREIWKTALDREPETAVCIFGSNNQREPTIDMDFPTLMHVCQESRAMALKSCKFRQIESNGTCLGSYRDFRPDLDALYISSRDWPDFFDHEFLDSWSQSAELRHLALDRRMLSEDDVANFAMHLEHLGGLQTVSIVFSEEGWVPRDHVPTGRLRYELFDCGKGETVWDSPRDSVRRRQTDPSEVVASFRDLLSTMEVGDLELAPFDGNSGEPLFDVVVQRIVPRSKHMLTGDQGSWASILLGGVRQFLS